MQLPPGSAGEPQPAPLPGSASAALHTPPLQPPPPPPACSLVYVCGVCTEHCIKATVLDALWEAFAVGVVVGAGEAPGAAAGPAGQVGPACGPVLGAGRASCVQCWPSWVPCWPGCAPAAQWRHALGLTCYTPVHIYTPAVAALDEAAGREALLEMEHAGAALVHVCCTAASWASVAPGLHPPPPRVSSAASVALARQALQQALSQDRRQHQPQPASQAQPATTTRPPPPPARPSQPAPGQPAPPANQHQGPPRDRPPAGTRQAAPPAGPRQQARRSSSTGGAGIGPGGGG